MYKNRCMGREGRWSGAGRTKAPRRTALRCRARVYVCGTATAAIARASRRARKPRLARGILLSCIHAGLDLSARCAAQAAQPNGSCRPSVGRAICVRASITMRALGFRPLSGSASRLHCSDPEQQPCGVYQPLQPGVLPGGIMAAWASVSIDVARGLHPFLRVIYRF